MPDRARAAATVRHEIWQYTNHYGGWVEDRNTKILDRVLMARSEFRRWTWVWRPRRGGIKVGEKPVTLSYEFPAKFDPKSHHGWFPD